MAGKKKKYLLLIFGVIALSLIASYFDSQVLSLNTDRYTRKKNVDKFNEVIRYMDNAYVEDINWKPSIEGAIEGMLETLDPHSVYITAEDAAVNEENFEGRYQGIGIHYDVIDGYLTVISVIPGSPSEEVGLQAGDRIVKINGKSAYDISMADVPKKLKGPAGSPVDVTIQRNGSEETFDVTIVRGEIPIFTLNTYFMVNENTGYVWVNRFARTTSTELEDALMDLEEHGMERLVLDLRGNGGGLLKEAVKVVAQFIPGHKKVVYTHGRFSRYDEQFFTDDFGVTRTYDVPLIVLLDGGSASASEIVAGALQDYDRALIIGTNSFGKGLVQNEFKLNDGSRIRLTVSKYYTPSGRLIQKPYKNKALDQYFTESAEPETTADSTSGDSLQNRPVYYTQNGRKVYGGGGITPDVKIEFNSDPQSNELIRKLMQKRVFFELAAELVHKNPDWSKSFKKFKNTFTTDKYTFRELKQIAGQKDIKIKDADIEKNKDYLDNRIKAEIARNIWGMSRYYEVLLEEDNQYRESLNYFGEAVRLANYDGDTIQK
jgi:carboxyl-terminal processing protease